MESTWYPQVNLKANVEERVEFPAAVLLIVITDGRDYFQSGTQQYHTGATVLNLVYKGIHLHGSLDRPLLTSTVAIMLLRLPTTAVWRTSQLPPRPFPSPPAPTAPQPIENITTKGQCPEVRPIPNTP